MNDQAYNFAWKLEWYSFSLVVGQEYCQGART